MQRTAQKASLSGITPTYTAASAGGDTFPNTGREYLHVKNGGGASITVTVDAVRACDQGFDHNASVAVPAGAERIIGPFDRHRFGANPSVTYTATASVTVAVIQLP